MNLLGVIILYRLINELACLPGPLKKAELGAITHLERVVDCNDTSVTELDSGHLYVLQAGALAGVYNHYIAKPEDFIINLVIIIFASGFV